MLFLSLEAQSVTPTPRLPNTLPTPNTPNLPCRKPRPPPAARSTLAPPATTFYPQIRLRSAVWRPAVTLAPAKVRFKLWYHPETITDNSNNNNRATATCPAVNSWHPLPAPPLRIWPHSFPFWPASPRPTEILVNFLPLGAGDTQATPCLSMGATPPFYPTIYHG